MMKHLIKTFCRNVLLSLFPIIILEISATCQEHKDWFDTRPAKERKIIKELKEYGINRQLDLMQLAVQGIDVKKVKQLKKVGVDLLKLSKPDHKSTYEEFSVLSECVIIGSIISIEYNEDSTACYHSKAKIRVQDFLKKPRYLKKDSDIIVLTGSGPLSGGRQVEYENDFKMEVGQKYLLFLSNIYMKYYLSTVKHCHDEYRENYFLATQRSPRVVNGEVWIPFTNEKIGLNKFLYKLKNVLQTNYEIN